MINVCSLFISFILSIICLPFILNMLKDNGSVCLNYKNEEIPIGLGLVFVIVQVITCNIVAIYNHNVERYTMIYIISILFIGIAGLLDDLIGDKNVKGFKGHIKSLFKGKLTTGGLKAIIGFLSSVLVSIIISNNVYEFIINVFIISLFTNFINLFDLRPGRASKVFIILSIILLISSNNFNYSFIILSMYGILMRYMPVDLKSNAMMGDVGSNVLGMTLGVYCALSHNITSKLIYLCILVVLQVLSEFISFTKIIENNKILKYIDNIGR